MLPFRTAFALSYCLNSHIIKKVHVCDLMPCGNTGRGKKNWKFWKKKTTLEFTAWALPECFIATLPP